MRKGILIRDCINPGNNHRTPKGTECYYSERLKSWLANDPTFNDPFRYPSVPENAVQEKEG